MIAIRGRKYEILSIFGMSKMMVAFLLIFFKILIYLLSSSMKKIFFGILIIFLLLGWIIYFISWLSDTPKWQDKWTFRTSQKETLSYEDKIKQDEETAVHDKGIYNNALKTQDTILCKDIINTDEKKRCYDMIGASVALKERKKEMCDTLSNSGIVERCRDNVSFSLAEKSWEKTMCALIIDENLRTQCEEMIDTKSFSLRVASGTIDTAFCGTLAGSVWDQCRAQVTRRDDKNSYNNALSQKTLESCDTIENEVLRSQCRDTIIFDMAIKQGDTDLCASISNKSRSEYCEKSLNVRNDTILYGSIVKEGDIIACDTLISLELKNRCHDVILIAQVRSNQDSALCENLYNTGMISSCRGLIRSK